jgi:hypothetical protein
MFYVVGCALTLRDDEHSSSPPPPPPPFLLSRVNIISQREREREREIEREREKSHLDGQELCDEHAGSRSLNSRTAIAAKTETKTPPHPLIVVARVFAKNNAAAEKQWGNSKREGQAACIVRKRES